MGDEPESSGGESPFGGFDQEPVRAREEAPGSAPTPASRRGLRINPTVAMALAALVVALPVLGIAVLGGGGGGDSGGGAEGGNGGADTDTSTGTAPPPEYSDCLRTARHARPLCRVLLAADSSAARETFRRCRRNQRAPKCIVEAVVADCVRGAGQSKDLCAVLGDRPTVRTYADCRASTSAGTCVRRIVRG